MAVYARGYRTYASEFAGPPACLTIFREGFRTALRGRGLRIIGVFFLIIFVYAAAALYIQVAIQNGASSAAGPELAKRVRSSARILASTLEQYYAAVAVLTALLAFFVGSGIVSDDLRTRGLSLYLVRPIRPIDYVAGKALILPGILFSMALLPGLLFLLLVAFWQPKGQSWGFLAEHADVAWLVLHHYLVASAAYTGLMLLLSSRTPRRGAVTGLAAAVVFGGMMFHGMASRMPGTDGDVLRLLDLPFDTLAGFIRHAHPRTNAPFVLQQPTAEAVSLVAAALLVVGLVAAYRRARTVEVAG